MNYDEAIAKIKEAYEEFLVESEAGKEGKGFKGHALKARKLSLKVANAMKEFRQASLRNDKGIGPVSEEPSVD